MGPEGHRSKTTSRNPLAHRKNSDAFSGLVRPGRAFYFGSGAFWWIEPCRIRPIPLKSRIRAQEIDCKKLHCFRYQAVLSNSS